MNTTRNTPPAAEYLGEWDIETTHPATGTHVCARCNEAVDSAVRYCLRTGADHATFNLNTHIAKVRRVGTVTQ